MSNKFRQTSLKMLVFLKLRISHQDMEHYGHTTTHLCSSLQGSHLEEFRQTSLKMLLFLKLRISHQDMEHNGHTTILL
jgi:hypothetical protein